MSSKENNKQIKKWDIVIYQDGIGGFPMGEPMISFSINEHSTVMLLEQFKNAVNIIYESQGNRSKEAYAAMDELKSFFGFPLSNFIDYSQFEIQEEKD